MKIPVCLAIAVGTIAIGCHTPQANPTVSTAPAQSASALKSVAPLSSPQPVNQSADRQKQAAQPLNPPALQPPTPRPTTPAQNMTVQYVAYHSNVLGVDRTYGVLVPPGYNENLQQRYPVIVLLHGGSGDQTDWFNPQKGNAVPTLQQLYAAGKLPPSIVITPDGNDLRGKSRYHDPQYFDGSNGRVATALGDELVQVIQSRYRTLNQPDFWAIGGLSSGAWGAVNIGLHFPNRYHVLFSHSGYFTDRSGPANSPQAYIKTLSAQTLKPLHIYLDSGSSDEDSLSESRAFYAQLQRLGVHSQFEIFPGSHTWTYWSSHLADSLTFVGQQFWGAMRSA